MKNKIKLNTQKIRKYEEQKQMKQMFLKARQQNQTQFFGEISKYGAFDNTEFFKDVNQKGKITQKHNISRYQ